MAYAAVMMIPYLVWSALYRKQVEQFLQFLMSGMEEGLTVTIAGIAGVEFAGGKAAETIIDKTKIQPVFDPDTVPVENESDVVPIEDEPTEDTEETGFIESVPAPEPTESAPEPIEEITEPSETNQNENNSVRSSRISKRGNGPKTKEQEYEDKLNGKLTQHFKDRKLVRICFGTLNPYFSDKNVNEKFKTFQTFLKFLEKNQSLQWGYRARRVLQGLSDYYFSTTM